MKTWMSACIACLVLGACTIPAIRVDPNLQTDADVYPVDGRQGWQIRQVLSFGEFHSGPVKRGWTRGYDYPFILRFSGASEKLEFTTTGPSGSRADVFVLGKLSEIDFTKFRQFFDVNLRSNDVFAGTVALAPSRHCDFYVDDLNQNVTAGETRGVITGLGADIEIRPIWHLENGTRSWDTRPLGFEFVENGVVTGAVETVNDGRVWLNRELADEKRLVIASVASALLLRSDLADHND